MLISIRQQSSAHGQRTHLPLFDTDRYVRDYEALLMGMFQRQQAGLPPAALLASPAHSAGAAVTDTVCGALLPPP